MKYPVKEPFVKLLKGSPQNFLNAFTYPDHTCHPVATTNTKDLYNLMHVYLNAVLHPRTVSDTQLLLQEGAASLSPLVLEGVVLKMKGVPTWYTTPDSLVSRATQLALFPSDAYSVDSGGNPLNIPELTFA